MDKPITQIISIKSLEQLRNYLEQRQNSLNLSIMLDKSNSTLLHFAAFKNDLPRMKIFIKNFKQYTQLHHDTGLYTGPSASNFNDKLKAWVNTSNKQGYIPLLYAGLHGNLQMIQFLQQCGSNMFYRTSKNENILFMCVEHNKIKALIYLLQSKHNYEINQTNLKGDTILHQACMKGYTQIVSYLLTMGADINAKNNDEQTPLMTATKQGKKQVVKLLLIKGADRGNKNKNGQTALQVAKSIQRQDLIRILDNNYGTCDKIKIKCNKKIIYEPEKPSYMYSIYFIVLFHLFFLPANLLSQFSISQKYVKIIPLMFQGIYELIILTVYFLLLRKPKKKKPMALLDIDGTFCAECKRKLGNKMFHCYICNKCINRYDHHCPWINNCVGAHNVGKFTFFLFVLLVGLVQVIFCSVCLLIGDTDFVRYRKTLQIPDGLHLPLNILTILFSSLLALGIVNLLIEQLKNLFTNSTGFERQQKQRSEVRKAELLTSQTSLNEQPSTESLAIQQQKQQSCRCFGNCLDMLTERS